MSVLFTGAKGEIACVDKVTPSIHWRSDACRYRASYIGLPSQRPVCDDHVVDYPRTRSVTAFDVARATCADCKATRDGEQVRRIEERRGKKLEKGAPAPRRRGHGQQFCERHDDEAFAAWQQDENEKGQQRHG